VEGVTGDERATLPDGIAERVVVVDHPLPQGSSALSHVSKWSSEASSTRNLIGH